MPRLHLAEIEDQPWCPAPIRDAGTDFLQFALHAGDNYAPVVPLPTEILRDAGTDRVVDLCSGGGGPWFRLLPALEAGGVAVRLCPTDRFPNPGAFRRVRRRLGERLGFEAEPVDAAAVPPHLRGVRTLFTAFHRFAPEAARAVLLDAVRAGQSIAVVETTERSPRAVLATALSPLLVLLATPWIRPLRASRLVWTDLLPLVPLLVLWDGWRVGQVRGRGPIAVTYLVGLPLAPQAARGAAP